MEIFVGNLPFDITEQEITDAFAAHGAVSGVKMLTDKFSGRFRGIAFVTMEDEAQALSAISALNGADLGGRPMRVDKSRVRSERISGFRPRENGGFRPRGKGFRPGRNFRGRDGGEGGEYKPRNRFRRRENFDGDGDGGGFGTEGGGEQ